MSKYAVMPLADYTSACDLIRQRTDTEDTVRSGDLEEKIDAVYSSGVNRGVSESGFWDLFQNYGKRTFYADGFRGSAFEYIRPLYKIVPTEQGGVARMFNMCKSLKKVEAEYFDFSQLQKAASSSGGFYHTFTACSKLEEIGDIGLEGQKYFSSTFNRCYLLKKIARIGVQEDTVFSGTFSYCESLEDVRFDGVLATDGLDLSESPKLNRKSLESILSCLKDFGTEEELFSGHALGNDYTETLGSGALVEGNVYKWSFYCSQYPGWLIDSAAVLPAEEKNIITSVAGRVTVDGNEYVGFTAVSPAWANASGAGTYTYTVYEDNGTILVKRSNIGESDIISISAVTVTEKHSVKLGEANLSKLTTEEINDAKAKGWTLE